MRRADGGRRHIWPEMVGWGDSGEQGCWGVQVLVGMELVVRFSTCLERGGAWISGQPYQATERAAWRFRKVGL